MTRDRQALADEALIQSLSQQVRAVVSADSISSFLRSNSSA